MNHVQIIATLEQPAALGRVAQADNRQPTYDHVPGSVLRGACAAAWLRDRAPDAKFEAIFEGEGTFGPLHCPESLPMPLSIWRHKHPTKCTKTSDYAIDAKGVTQCPGCSLPLEQSKGAPLGVVATVHRLRSALDINGVALEQQLFEVSTLSRGTQWRGWVTGPAVNAFRQQDGSPVTSLRLGGGRSTHGLATITVDQNAVPDGAETVGNDVVLRLASPGIFVDEFGFPADRPSIPDLCGLLGLKKEQIRLLDEDVWVRWIEVGGWHAASGLPKPRERAVAPGSTFRIRCDAAPDPASLVTVMATGIGLRRREGFGALYRMPDNTPLVSVAAWKKEAYEIRGQKWDVLLPQLRNRARFWPPDPAADEALRTGHPELDDRQSRALDLLLSITDHAVYLDVLRELEKG